MSRILVVEDDAELLLGLRDNLELDGYSVITATDGQAGLAQAFAAPPDAIILDVMLPGLSGFEVCRSLRKRGLRVPILMLTARSLERDKVLGLEFGADDYVTKPFSINELIARVRALLRRSTLGSFTPDVYQFGNVELDFGRHQARKQAEPLAMSALEFAVMRYLITRRGEAISRDELLADVWGHHSFPTTRSVDSLIARLRQKLEDDAHQPRHLLTVHGTGYKFVD